MREKFLKGFELLKDNRNYTNPKARKIPDSDKLCKIMLDMGLVEYDEDNRLVGISYNELKKYISDVVNSSQMTKMERATLQGKLNNWIYVAICASYPEMTAHLKDQFS